MNRHPSPSANPTARESQAPGRPPLLDSQKLLQGHRAVEIHHNGELYRLQATRSGKLILTK
jgi:hemin uptake protein HemP